MRVFQTPVTVIVACVILAGSTLAKEERSPLEEKLNSIIIAKVEWRQSSLHDAIGFLEAEAKRLDPATKGVDIVVKIQKGSDLPAITITASDLTLQEALKLVSDVSGLKMSVEKKQVVLSK